MTKYNLAFTYKPKIPGVRNYTIRQTIRMGERFKKGDLVRSYGWEGKPRQKGSTWAWTTDYTPLNKVINIYIYPEGIEILQNDGKAEVDFYAWDSDYLNILALWDGINPPTGLELRRIFIEMHRLFKEREPPSRYKAQIIRWDRPSDLREFMEERRESLKYAARLH